MFQKIRDFLRNVYGKNMDMLTSKKFRAAIIAAVVAVLAKAGFNVDIEYVTLLVSPFLIYIFGQGMADFSKEKAKTE